MTEHVLEFDVRDYELDLQGIVNNANYQHYLEHARHVFLCDNNLDFEKLHHEGKDLVVTKIEMEYKSPLKSRDKFKVVSTLKKESHVRFVFYQDIYRLPDEKLMLKGKVTGVCLRNGRPVKTEEVFDLEVL